MCTSWFDIEVLYLTLAGAEVVITDYEELLPIIEQNIKANTKEEHKVSVSALKWYKNVLWYVVTIRGEDVSKLKPPFDYVILSNIGISISSFFPHPKKLKANHINLFWTLCLH